MTVYGAVSFALIQVADPLVKALLLPDVFLTCVVVILMLGFPLALVLAWAEIQREIAVAVALRKTSRLTTSPSSGAG